MASEGEGVNKRNCERKGEGKKARTEKERKRDGRIYHMAFWASAQGPVDSRGPRLSQEFETSLGQLESMNKSRLTKQIYRANVRSEKVGKDYPIKSYADKIGGVIKRDKIFKHSEDLPWND
ncbi:hypothetical protein EVAR_83109_1 [Eumeta japonica]|uniref:Uncharacterized protein n=1 Tax=Eumeta variegata TaxID=151549 RepID=A0A4C1WLE3_EUMVA|nr:hypothetical protein EVAR_83109_1 [Eumeta japonica]